MAAIPYCKIMGTRREQLAGALRTEVFCWKVLKVLVLFLVLAIIQACTSRRPNLPALSRSRIPPRAGSASAQTQRPRAKPKIRAPLPDENSLVAKLTHRTPPHRAASLRLTEEGKRLLESGQYDKALARLEKTLAIDSTNPYVYYYLAKAHYHVGHHQESFNFLEVAESVLSGQPYWLAEVYSLKGENFRALGFLNLAVSNFNKALQLNPGNQVASNGLTRLRREIKVPSLR